jgi:hypothetical protein
VPGLIDRLATELDGFSGHAAIFRQSPAKVKRLGVQAVGCVMK